MNPSVQFGGTTMTDATPTRETTASRRAATAGMDRRDGFAPIFVESLEVRNFRGIPLLRVELEPDVTLLVGRNNAGKSRVLRALALAFGAVQAEQDDLTVGSAAPATIDVVVAPRQDLSAATLGEEAFEASIGRSLEPSIVQDEPLRERFAWRTTVSKSAEGVGARAVPEKLDFSADRGWFLRSAPVRLKREQFQMFEAAIIGTRRDLSAEMTSRGSAIQRILSDLEIPDDDRETFEGELKDLGGRIVAGSGSLAAVRESLRKADASVGGLGQPELNPLPLRLEELARSVSVDIDAGTGSLPLRFHGSGPRSLASLLVQTVLYERRLGKDGPSVLRLPLTLIEEPEAHLHPQMQFELPDLLRSIPGQLVLSTHSSHLVTVVDPRSLRILGAHSDPTKAVDLRPAETDEQATHRARRPKLHAEEMEKLKRQVERPFGELLFASALVMGDGATERGLLPPLIRHALGPLAHGVCVIDPGSMNSPFAVAAVKFARLVGIPWYLFADGDKDGAAAVKVLCDTHGDTDDLGQARAVLRDVSGASERMMVAFDDDLCRAAALAVRPGEDQSVDSLELLTRCKGSVGPHLAHELISRHPSPKDWPDPLRRLVETLRLALSASPEVAEEDDVDDG